MEAVVSGFLISVAGLLSVQVAVYCIEIFAGIALPTGEFNKREATRVPGRVCVLVPAHNEGSGLLPTLNDIQPHLLPRDRLVVVADNCTDDTSIIASAAGAEVVERHDSSKRGKGYALDFGLRHLSADPPDFVIVVDADCRVAPDTIRELVSTCAHSGRPAQALDLMIAPGESQISHQVSEFAWRVKNWLRPLGLFALGLPCHLLGTGMAFPWHLIRSADLANGCLVEDLKLGLDLAQAGYPPVFCPSACVTSPFPSSAKAAAIQRERWERGHVNTILGAVPRLICRAIAQRNIPLLALALDLAVPPVSLLGILLAGTWGITLLAALVGTGRIALLVITTAGLAFLSASILAWLKCGRDVLPLTAISLVLQYVLGKLSLYCRIIFKHRHTPWIRTDRTKSQ